MRAFDRPGDTSSFYNRGALLFFAILMNAFQSNLEILQLYEQRPIGMYELPLFDSTY